MKYWVPKNWSTSFDHEGLLFFVQRLQEMLYHFTSDIYRAPVHNTSTLLFEFDKTARDVKSEKVKEYQLVPIFDELKESFLGDKILRWKVGDEYVDDLAQQMRSAPENNRTELVNYITEAIIPNYSDWSVEYLKAHIPNGKHKIEIEKGIRSWISDVIMSGYTSEFIYTFIEDFFINGNVESLETLDTFFDRFDFEEREYKVYIQLSNRIEPCFNIMNKRLHLIFEDDGRFESISRRKNHTICYFEIKALDYYSAVLAAYDKINIFLKYYRFLADKRTYLLYKYGAVWDDDMERMFFLPVIPTGFKTMEFQKGQVDPDTIDSMILGIQDNGAGGLESFNRVLALHNNALQQQLPQDGFTNLWSILEILCPQGNASSKLDPIMYGILPVLQNDYYERVFNAICRDLEENLTGDDFGELMDKLGGTTDIEKIASFCWLPEYEDLRENYFQKLSENPLLRHKIYTLYDLRNNKKAIFDITKQYYHRIKWHFYRLYRTRNAIVHSGEVPDNTRVLGEHLHTYIDSVLIEIANKLADNRCIGSISNYFIDTQLLLKRKEKHFSDAEPISDKDIAMLFESYFCPISAP